MKNSSDSDNLPPQSPSDAVLEEAASEAAQQREFPDAGQLALLRGLAQIVQQEKLSELEMENDGVRLTLRTTLPVPAASALPSAPGPSTPFAPAPFMEIPFEAAPFGEPPFEEEKWAEPEAEDIAPDQRTAIEAPMVGVFYRSPSPSDPSFVEVGDRVEVGQPVGIIEAMKVFNEILSEVEGVVAEIAVENAELVETGAPLMYIKPG